MAHRTRRVVWTPRARDGLDDIVSYIAEDSPNAAKRVLDVVLRTASSLSELSGRGRVVPEIAEESVREVFIYSYRLMYEVLNDEVRVLAILHGARDFDRWLSERGNTD